MVVKDVINTSKVIFFDLDDTLLNSVEAKWAQHKFVAKKYYNKELSDEELLIHWGKPYSKMVCLLYGTDEPQIAFKYIQSCDNKYPKKLFVYTIPTLLYLKKLKKIIGVLTATSRESFLHDIKIHNIPISFFDYIQTEGDSDFHKPDPKVFQPAITWLQKKHIKPNEALYVGDGLHDMKAALGAGLNFIGVCTGLVTAKEFMKYNVESISDIGQLVNY
jgi:phosphoglycolate phosphatase